VRILALYDIHGNPDALEAVLGDPRAQAPDVAVVGGDAVPGPLARQVLDRLDGLDIPLRWVRGNGEREVAAAAARRSGCAPEADDPVARTAAATVAQLGAARARTLGELPLTQTIDGVLFCHASPRRDDEMLTRLSPPERWSEALAGIDAALVVGATPISKMIASWTATGSSTRAASDFPTRVTANRGGCGSRTASPSCGAPPMTTSPRDSGCGIPAFRTAARSRDR
jgi:hypothetical protein